MSVRATSEVWRHSTASGSALLTLVAVSDHAHDDGTQAWMSVASLARKTRQDRRTVQRHLRALEDAGELRAVGSHASGTTIYRLLCGALDQDGAWADPDPSLDDADDGGVNLPPVEGGGDLPPGGGGNLPPGGAAHGARGGGTLPPKPSMNHQGKAAAKRERETDAAAAALDEDDPRSLAFAALTERGTDPPVARDLASNHADRVLPLCARFDAEVEAARERGSVAPGPGWLVRAIRDGWNADQRPKPSRVLQAKQAARSSGPLPEAERAMARQREMNAEAAPSSDVPDWRDLMEADRVAELKRQDAARSDRPSRSDRLRAQSSRRLS